MDLYPKKVDIHKNTTINGDLTLNGSDRYLYMNNNEIRFGASDNSKIAIKSNGTRLRIKGESHIEFIPEGETFISFILTGNKIYFYYYLYGFYANITYLYYSTLSQTSDDRFKTNEIPITQALSTILKLKPEIYTKTVITKDYDNSASENYYKTEEPFTESGFIAQDTYNNVPELRHLISGDKEVFNNPNNFNESGNLIEDVVDNNGEQSYLGINYTGIIPYLVGAIKELNTNHVNETTQLKTEINSLKTTISTLESQFNILQEQMNTLLNQ